jgi:hypothetical protein
VKSSWVWYHFEGGAITRHGHGLGTQPWPQGLPPEPVAGRMGRQAAGSCTDNSEGYSLRGGANWWAGGGQGPLKVLVVGKSSAGDSRGGSLGRGRRHRTQNGNMSRAHQQVLLGHVYAPVK